MAYYKISVKSAGRCLEGAARSITELERHLGVTLWEDEKAALREFNAIEVWSSFGRAHVRRTS